MGRINYYLVNVKDPSYNVCTFSGLPSWCTSYIAAHKGRMQQKSTHLAELKFPLKGALKEAELEFKVSSACPKSHLIASVELFWMTDLSNIPAHGNIPQPSANQNEAANWCVVKSLRRDMQAVIQVCATGPSVMVTQSSKKEGETFLPGLSFLIICLVNTYLYFKS